MRLLLDELLSPVIAEQLRTRGHDVEAINGDPRDEAVFDSAVMDIARAEHRAVVTNNLIDFRPLHHDAIAPGGPGPFGMVFMAGNYRRTKAVILTNRDRAAGQARPVPGRERPRQRRDLAVAEDRDERCVKRFTHTTGMYPVEAYVALVM